MSWVVKEVSQRRWHKQCDLNPKRGVSLVKLGVRKSLRKSSYNNVEDVLFEEIKEDNTVESGVR